MPGVKGQLGKRCDPAVALDLKPLLQGTLKRIEDRTNSKSRYLALPPRTTLSAPWLY